MAKSDTYSASLIYLHILQEGLKRHGIDSEQFKQSSGLDIPTAMHSNERLSVKEVLEYWQQGIEIAHTSHLGLECGYHIHPSDYGIMSHVWMNCSSLGDAFQLVHDYKKLMNEAFQTELVKVKDNTLVYTLDFIDVPDQAGSALVELDFASIYHMGVFLAERGHKDKVFFKEVHFKHKPNTDLAFYEKCFGCEVLFEQAENRLIADVDLWKIPVHAPNPALLSAILKIVDKAVAKDLGIVKHSFSDQVLDHIKQHLGHAFPDAEKVAQHFGYSLSSFKRALQKENTNYQELCNQVRKSAAKQMLARPGSSLSEIAFFLGFANASAFHRAFKRWYGVTPNDFRKQQA